MNPPAPGRDLADLPWWALAADLLLQRLDCASAGLSSDEAARRLGEAGANLVVEAPSSTLWRLALRQFSSPLVLILVAGALISLVIGDWADALIILAIVAGSAGLGFTQEARASAAVAALHGRLALTTRTRRDGLARRIPASELVPGDVIELTAGNLVPADGVVLEARDFLVIESSLTGESFPVEKQPGMAARDAPLGARTNCVFLGSSVRSGAATVLVVRTGRDTAMGEVAGRLAQRPPQTEFERGVRSFGEMLLRVMTIAVVCVLAANQWLGRPVVESLLFAVALAVGLSPELLPAIVSVLLARSTRALAREGVLVRRLQAIEDLGGMDVLCTDKTGTLTVGVMALDCAIAADGSPDPRVLRWAHLNASFETGIENPLDAALVQAGERAGLRTDGWRKVDEIPYDFSRRRLAIAVAGEDAPGVHRLVVKGAFAQTLAACASVRSSEAELALDEDHRGRIEARVQALGEQGLRVLAVATRTLPARARCTIDDEAGLTLEGFVCFSDPPKPGAAEAIRDLRARGVRVKMITGDNRYVAGHLARQVGLDCAASLTGEELTTLRDESLWHLAERTDVFAEVDPAQKERIVRALQRTGHAVGYLGDGINDAPSLHAADVGISVDGAVDVARESADVVLLRPDLDAIRRGVEGGRHAFANTLKYIAIATSATFGNMVSMALATPLLPFLPLTAGQILLNNFLSDLPSMAISTDRVDPDRLQRPQRWDVRRVRRFMLTFGLTSSVFDMLTFAVLLGVFATPEPVFRTAWFVESLLTQLAVLLVLRTTAPAWRSRPSPLLLGATLAVGMLALALPWSGPAAALFGFVPLPPSLTAAMLAIVLAYVAVTELTKRWFARG